MACLTTTLCSPLASSVLRKQTYVPPPKKERETNSTSDEHHDNNHVPSQENNWCPASFIDGGADKHSTSLIWDYFSPQILNATYQNLPTYFSLNATMKDEYMKWIDQLYSFYTASRLRRSVMYPAEPNEIIHILKKVEEIKHYNENVADINNKRKLRVLVLGGSVTAGMYCYWPTIFGIPKLTYFESPNCKWSILLEKLLNEILFDGQEGVEVQNMATGGQTSEYGSLLLEYELFPDPERVPDIIISAFAANESREPDLEKVFYEYIQHLVKSARGLLPCSDDAPLVIMVDDFYGDLPFDALRQTGKTYMVSNWFHVMAVDYASTVKHKVFTENATQYVPLIAGNYQMHQSVGMHMGIGFTIAFNIMNSIVNVCNDSNLSKGVLQTQNLSKEKNDSSIIDPSLLENVRKGDPSFHKIGYFTKEIGRKDQIQQDYVDNTKNAKANCDRGNIKACSWAWFYNGMSGFVQSSQIRAQMNEVLLQKNGWVAEGFPVRQPRSGWYSHTANSTFSFKIENTTVNTNYIVINSMKSYSEKWKGSKLGVSVSIFDDPVVPETALNREGAVNWDEKDEIYLIDGFHEIKTSVHFTHKIPVKMSAKAGRYLHCCRCKTCRWIRVQDCWNRTLCHLNLTFTSY